MVCCCCLRLLVCFALGLCCFVLLFVSTIKHDVVCCFVCFCFFVLFDACLSLCFVLLSSL